VLAAVSTQNKILLGGMALVFIVFAMLSSFYFPRRNPDFPTRRNLFLLATGVLFVGMLLAVEFFAVEEEEEPQEPEARAVLRS
jgi:hypothetical protein